jgi:hypothetical protein
MADAIRKMEEETPQPSDQEDFEQRVAENSQCTRKCLRSARYRYKKIAKRHQSKRESDSRCSMNDRWVKKRVPPGIGGQKRGHWPLTLIHP